MVTCPNCKRELPDGLLFCTNCGASLPQTSPPPTNMNSAAFSSSSIISPAKAPASPPKLKDPNKKQNLPLIIGIAAGALVLIITIVVIIVIVTSRNRPVSNYTIPAADQVTPSTTTTVWLGNYFFSIPETFNFEVGLDDPYEAIYIQRANTYKTTTEIAFADDLPFTEISSGDTVRNFSTTLAGYLNATDTKVSATAINGIDFYYMDFATAGGQVLIAFSPANDASFVTTVAGQDSLSVEERLTDSAIVLSTAKEMAAADKGIPDNVKDIVNTGSYLEDLRGEE